MFGTACATVFLGTLYPLFIEALNGSKISVGPPFFNATFVPLMVPLIFLMAVGPMLPWKRADLLGADHDAQAALAASIFHFKETTVPEVKRRLLALGIPVRAPSH